MKDEQQHRRYPPISGPVSRLSAASCSQSSEQSLYLDGEMKQANTVGGTRHNKQTLVSLVLKHHLLLGLELNVFLVLTLQNSASCLLRLILSSLCS